MKLLHWDRAAIPLEKRSSPEFYVKSTGWDAMLAGCPWAANAFRSCFKYQGEILEFGYPANDIFSHRDRYHSVRSEIRMQLGIRDDAPVFLYAPTWRDGKHLGNAMFHFDLLLDPSAFLSAAPEDSWLLVRAHHMSAVKSELSALPEHAVNVSHFDDAIELMCAADVLITDYSSIATDWYCSRKPIMYYVPDYETYKVSLRGMYFELEDFCAGKIYYNQDSLLSALESVLESDQSPYDDYYDKYCSLNDGGATDRTIDYLLSQ